MSRVEKYFCFVCKIGSKNEEKHRVSTVFSLHILQQNISICAADINQRLNSSSIKNELRHNRYSVTDTQKLFTVNISRFRAAAAPVRLTRRRPAVPGGARPGRLVPRRRVFRRVVPQIN